MTPAAIIAARKALGMSQAELAASLGKSKQAVQSWESGISRCSDPAAVKSTLIALLSTRMMRLASLRDEIRFMASDPSPVGRPRKPSGKPDPVTIRGRRYHSAGAAARALGVTYQAIVQAKKRGRLDFVGLRKGAGNGNG